ncbi:MAG: capsular polysaccharide biosynthesis protein [Acidobacteria bacterium]|nr:capsular polysaccharide biosynthesis protein [Acidobacteriota bacterium]
MTGSLRSVATLGAVSAASAVLTIAYVAICGRRLGPAEYSDFAAAMSMIQLLALMGGPIGPAAARLVTRYRARGERENVAGLRHAIGRWIARRRLWIAIIAVGIALGLSRATHLRSPLVSLLAVVSTMAVTMLGIDRGILQGLGALRGQNVNLLLEPVLRLGTALPLLATWPSATAALVAYALAPVAAELHLASGFRRDWREIVPASVNIGEMNRTLVPLAVIMGAFALFQNVDVLAAKRYLSPSEAGLYGAAVSLMRAFSVTFFPTYVLAGPMLTELHEAGLRVTGATLKLCGWFVAASSVPLVLFVTIPGPIIVALYGVAYQGSARYLRVIAPLAVLTWLSLMLAQGLVTLGSRGFVKVWIAFAAVQLGVLALLHDDAMQIVRAMYIVQVPLFLATAMLLLHADRKQAETDVESP